MLRWGARSRTGSRFAMRPRRIADQRKLTASTATAYGAVNASMRSPPMPGAADLRARSG